MHCYRSVGLHNLLFSCQSYGPGMRGARPRMLESGGQLEGCGDARSFPLIHCRFLSRGTPYRYTLVYRMRSFHTVVHRGQLRPAAIGLQPIRSCDPVRLPFIPLRGHSCTCALSTRAALHSMYLPPICVPFDTMIVSKSSSGSSLRGSGQPSKGGLPAPATI